MRNLPPDHMASHHSSRYLPWKGYTWLTCEVQAQIYKYTNRIHSFHWHVQNVSIPCRSQELLKFFSVIYPFLPPYSTNQSSILPHFILPSISWSTSQPCCFQIHIQYFLRILFSSILCTCPNQCNLFKLIVSVTVGFLTIA